MLHGPRHMLKSQPQRPSKSTAEMFKVKIFRTRFIVALWGTFGPELSPDIPLGGLVKQFWFGEHFGTKYGRNSCRLGARSQQAVETGAGICGNVWVTAWKVSAGAQGDEGPGVLAAKAFQGHSGHSVTPSLGGYFVRREVCADCRSLQSFVGELDHHLSSPCLQQGIDSK